MIFAWGAPPPLLLPYIVGVMLIVLGVLFPKLPGNARMPNGTPTGFISTGVFVIALFSAMHLMGY
jgi:hypothetical protein